MVLGDEPVMEPDHDGPDFCERYCGCSQEVQEVIPWLVIVGALGVFVLAILAFALVVIYMRP